MDGDVGSSAIDNSWMCVDYFKWEFVGAKRAKPIWRVCRQRHIGVFRDFYQLLVNDYVKVYHKPIA